MALSLLNQPSVLTPNVRRILIDALMPMFEASYEATGGTFPGRAALQAEYASSHDLEVLELTSDFHPDPFVANLARGMILRLRRASC